MSGRMATSRMCPQSCPLGAGYGACGLGRRASKGVVEHWRIELLESKCGCEPSGVVAVHCVAGLGRAPVLAALALMEFERVKPMDAIEKIKERRKGSFNTKQIQFLRDYTLRRKPPPCCAVM